MRSLLTRRGMLATLVVVAAWRLASEWIARYRILRDTGRLEAMRIASRERRMDGVRRAADSAESRMVRRASSSKVDPGTGTLARAITVLAAAPGGTVALPAHPAEHQEFGVGAWLLLAAVLVSAVALMRPLADAAPVLALVAALLAAGGWVLGRRR